MKSTSQDSTSLDTLIAFCKRRGFVFQSAEIYGGLNGVYDFGHLGTLLKENIKKAWLESLFHLDREIIRLDGALLGPEAMWKASGHLEHFSDPMVDCHNCKRRYRADEIDLTKSCPHCGKKEWTAVRQFNMMFSTQLGAAADKASQAFLRPETAQTIFVNFKNIITTHRVKVPFGVAQIGKAFRNEITPKQFLFRMREFEQMELEWFCKPENARDDFTFWVEQRKQFYKNIGISADKIKLKQHAQEELSHYSAATTDIEYEFPFGYKELEGIANRQDFDLLSHSRESGKDLSVFDEETKQSYIPYVIESSVGVDRLFLTVLFDAYHEEIVDNETRTVLKLNPKLAPIKAAFFPLAKSLAEPVERIYKTCKKAGFMVEMDISGSIGKRYRRQDEIGTPFCFTYDFESQASNTVTLRHRDTMQQERISLDHVETFLKNQTA